MRYERSDSRPTLEMVEPRLLLSSVWITDGSPSLAGIEQPSVAGAPSRPSFSGVDLVGTLSDWTLGDVNAPGDTATAWVDISNIGDALATGKVKISIYASTSGEMDGHSILLGTVRQSISDLGNDDSPVSVAVDLSLPKNMPFDSYCLITKIESAVDGDSADNVSVDGYFFDVEVLSADLCPCISEWTLPDYVFPGRKGTATVTIDNYGDGAADGQISILIYASLDDTLDHRDILLGSVRGQSIHIESGDYADIAVNVSVPAGMAAGDYYTIAVVDTGNILQDYPEDAVSYCDQMFTIDEPYVDLSLPPVSGIDLVGSLTDWTLAGWTFADANIPGDSGVAWVDISNIGHAKATGKVKISIYATTTGEMDGGAILVGSATPSISGLRDGDTVSADVNVVLPQDMAEGSYSLVAVIESAADGDLTDNISVNDCPVNVELPAADLTTWLEDWNLTGPVLPGATGTATVTIYNNGNLRAVGQVGISVYASLDDSLDGGDILLGSVEGQSIDIGVDTADSYDYADVSVSISVPAGMAGGHYHIITQIDTGDIVQSCPEDAVSVSDRALDVALPKVDVIVTAPTAPPSTTTGDAKDRAPAGNPVVPSHETKEVSLAGSEDTQDRNGTQPGYGQGEKGDTGYDGTGTIWLRACVIDWETSWGWDIGLRDGYSVIHTCDIRLYVGFEPWLMPGYYQETFAPVISHVFITPGADANSPVTGDTAYLGCPDEVFTLHGGCEVTGVDKSINPQADSAAEAAEPVLGVVPALGDVALPLGQAAAASVTVANQGSVGEDGVVTAGLSASQSPALESSATRIAEVAGAPMMPAEQGGSYGTTVSLSVSPDMAVDSRFGMPKADPADVTGVDLIDNIALSDAYVALV